MPRTRIRRDDIRVLSLWKSNVWAGDNQYWCSTPRAYELWWKDPANGLDYRVKRFPKDRVLFVGTHQGTD